MVIVEMQRDLDDKLPKYAWPGGYPIVYYTGNGEPLCADCATIELDDLCDADNRSWYDGWDFLHYADVHYEGIEYCVDCGTTLIGAYEDND